MSSFLETLPSERRIVMCRSRFVVKKFDAVAYRGGDSCCGPRVGFVLGVVVATLLALARPVTAAEETGAKGAGTMTIVQTVGEIKTKGGTVKTVTVSVAAGTAAIDTPNNADCAPVAGSGAAAPFSLAREVALLGDDNYDVRQAALQAIESQPATAGYLNSLAHDYNKTDDFEVACSLKQALMVLGPTVWSSMVLSGSGKQEYATYTPKLAPGRRLNIRQMAALTLQRHKLADAAAQSALNNALSKALSKSPGMAGFCDLAKFTSAVKTTVSNDEGACQTMATALCAAASARNYANMFLQVDVTYSNGMITGTYKIYTDAGCLGDPVQQGTISFSGKTSFSY
jgi:hypothetical protein